MECVDGNELVAISLLESMGSYSDRHTLELHSPVAKAPLIANSVVKREQLTGISGPVGGRLATHVTVILEVSDVPLDTVRDFLGQFSFGHWIWRNLVVLGRELLVFLLAMN